MIQIQSGSFTMGSSEDEPGHSRNEAPAHVVRIDYDFEIGKYPVTFREWDLAMQNGFSGPRTCDQGWGRGRRPVINVSYLEILKYIDWLNNVTQKLYRLPSEAEWEYVCRAGTTSRYSFGDTITRKQAQFRAKGPAPVDRFPPNQWGVVGMHGNTFEWCEDCWNDSYVDAPSDGSPWTNRDCNNRIWRGGAWGGSPEWLRSATRFHYEKDFRYCDGGFRLVRTLD
jgi:formylglycine-generating enzyme required for sulfatase activity